MKKTILLFLFILPVVIAVLIIAITGFVGRSVMVIPIQSVMVDNAIFNSNEGFHAQYGTNNFILIANRGDNIEFMDYVTIYPANATGSLEFYISNPHAVEVSSGQIRILANARFSDPATGIEVRVNHGAQHFFSIFVIIAPDENHFDYFGFCGDLFSIGADEDWFFNYGLSIAFNDYGEFYLRINRDVLYYDGIFNTLPIGQILERGFNIAPNTLLNIGHPSRDNFLLNTSFASSDNTILTVAPHFYNGIKLPGQFNAIIVGRGLVYIYVNTTFSNANMYFRVPVYISGQDQIPTAGVSP